MAEGVLIQMVKDKGLDIRIDSAGTSGYHIDAPPDERTLEVLENHNILLESKSRKLKQSDFFEFDVIIGMDKANIANIERVRPKDSTAKVVLFGSYVDGKEIRDPYYDNGLEGFEKAYKQSILYGEALLAAEI